MPVDDVDAPLGLVLVVAVDVPQRLHRDLDGGDGRPKFVAGVGDEIGLHLHGVGHRAHVAEHQQRPAGGGAGRDRLVGQPLAAAHQPHLPLQRRQITRCRRTHRHLTGRVKQLQQRFVVYHADCFFSDHLCRRQLQQPRRRQVQQHHPPGRIGDQNRVRQCVDQTPQIPPLLADLVELVLRVPGELIQRDGEQSQLVRSFGFDPRAPIPAGHFLGGIGQAPSRPDPPAVRRRREETDHERRRA